MIKKKKKEIQKNNSTINCIDITNINKFKNIKSINQDEKYKKIENIKKDNLPELKLKSRVESDRNLIYNKKNQSNIIMNNNLNNISNIKIKKLIISNKPKNNSLNKKNEVIFPKINNLNKNVINQRENHSNNELNDNHNSEDEYNYSFSNDYRNMNFNTINDSYAINKIKNSSRIYNGMNNLSLSRKKNNINKHHKLKLKKTKNSSVSQILPNNIYYKQENNDNIFKHNLLLQYMAKDNISIPLLNASSSHNIHIEKDINNITSNENKVNINSINNKNNNIHNLKLMSTKNMKQNSPIKNPNIFSNELKEIDNTSERINKINLLLNKISPLSSSSSNSLINKNLLMNHINYPFSKTIEISADIIKQSFHNFEESVTSYYNEFSSNSNILIKGYAYNTSKGIIRNYNEDTITVKKIILDNKNDEFFYFFGLFDGHGGNGCSLYLKENFHNFIKEFSADSLRNAVYQSENEFLTKKALDENNNICDSSGSCGAITIVKNNKLIISNTGDSRIVVYKNGKLFFATEDHKPNSDKEKERIKNSGGQIYQTTSLIPLYYNGKKIDLPWRVFPGRLSVSRTFGDIGAKNEKFGGKKGVIIPSPDITEFEINNEFDFMVIGCDGIFDVLSNEDLYEIWKIVLKIQKDEIEKYKDIEKNTELNIDKLCGDFAALIIKSAMAKNSLDNVSCIVVLFNINSYENENNENNNLKNSNENLIEEIKE